jgi:UTP--glucose-1-phosphate uridylyltransferase
MKGVILAAGYGTRFLPASKTVPKEMFPLIDRPAIAFVVDEFIRSGICEILIVTSRRKKALEDYFDREIELVGGARERRGRPCSPRPRPAHLYPPAGHARHRGCPAPLRGFCRRRPAGDRLSG